MSEIFCEKCGNIVQPKDRFCRRCGSPIDSEAVTVENTQSLNSPSFIERSLAMTAHFSQFLGFLFVILAPSLYITDFFASTILELVGLSVGPIVSLIIYSLSKSHFRFASFQSSQALIFQSILFFVIGIMSAVFWDYLNGPEALLLGLCMVPLEYLWFLVAFIGGITSMLGKAFRYPVIGKWITES